MSLFRPCLVHLKSQKVFSRIRIRIRIMSTMLDKIGLDVDIINIQFKYSDTDTVSDVECSDLDMNRSKSL